MVIDCAVEEVYQPVGIQPHVEESRTLISKVPVSCLNRININLFS